MTVTVVNPHSVAIDSPKFAFVYNDPDYYLKPEAREGAINFGGLQCQFQEGTKEYKELYIQLIVITKAAIAVNQMTELEEKAKFAPK